MTLGLLDRLTAGLLARFFGLQLLFSGQQPRAQQPMSSSFTHIDSANRPTMVDVGDKEVTKRAATAQSRVRFPPTVAEALRNQGFSTSKGPVFQTAIIAGVMGAKRTHELIPFCHPLGLENCKVTIDMQGDEAVIVCTASLQGKTGVEMEALTGASVAALTIYDMCKALSHEIEIGPTRLISKTGGRSGTYTSQKT
jgi:cyclic pyranopterin monophosphate synthase